MASHSGLKLNDMGLNEVMRKVAEQHKQASIADAIEIKVGVELIDIADKELTDDMVVFVCSKHQRNRIIEALRIADKKRKAELETAKKFKATKTQTETWRQMIQDYENIIKLIRDEDLHKWENFGSSC